MAKYERAEAFLEVLMRMALRLSSLLEMRTDGRLTDKMAFDVCVHLTPSPDYAGIARSCGAYGRKVEDPTDVIASLKKGLAEVRKGKAAVLDIRLSNT